MRRLFVACAVVVSAAALAPTCNRLNAQTTHLVLDESCSMRRYYRFGEALFSAELLKSEGEKILGKGGLDRVRRDTEKQMSQKGINPASADWREHVVQPVYPNFAAVPAPWPSEDWTAVDFDDGSWVRARFPFQGGPAAQISKATLGQMDESVDLGLLSAFYRARFVVDDPGKVGALSLHVVYTGGARVFVNGQEVARGGLLKGSLAPDVPGDDYPTDAYKDPAKKQCDRTIGPARVDPKLLRKGTNVLAVEIRASRLNPVALLNPKLPNWGASLQRPWPHARLSKLELRSDSASVRSNLKRPAEFQVWVEDVNRRVASDEFLAPGEPPGVIRLVGAAGGTYSAQVVVGADKPVADLAVVPGELAQASGTGKLPASAIQILYGVAYPLDEWTMKDLGDERGLDAKFPGAAQLADFAAMKKRGTYVFDQLAAAAPKSVPADTCRPVWISLKVPEDAAPGQYRGTVTVKAAATNPVSVPVEFEVVAWRLPEPRDFRTLVGCEENPYGVAKQYGVKPWSPEHFRRVESALKHLGRVGNSWVNVPIIVNTEFGNGEDSMVRWTRKGQSFAFDFGVLDQYLDLVEKYCGKPRVVQFVVMQGMPARAVGAATPPAQVKVGGTLVTMGPLAGASGEVKQAWQSFAAAALDHMKARGLEKSMYWGAPLEGEADPDLKKLLAQAAPQVFWTAGPHEMMSNGTFAKDTNFYHLVTTIRYWGGWPHFRTDSGWKSPMLHLLNPRPGGTVFAIHTTSQPFAWRVLPDRAVAFGRSGFTRVGADEWAAIHYEGMAVPRWLTGMPALFLLWPGKDGAETSARFENLIEGVQETEARIFIEQALDKGGLSGPLAARAKKLLADNLNETRFFQGNSILYAFEEYPWHWQERSRALYEATADVAKAAGK